jgi:hypothetical protein
MNDFYTYILTPRVDNEFLKPFRKLFQENFDNGFITKSRENPGLIADWIRSNITRNNTANYSRAPLTPAGVYELKVADDHSADICFVAICRSFGIPARLDPATRVPQYMSGKGWQDVFLYDAKQEAGKKGVVILTNPASNKLKPEYTIHYTLETYHQGFFRTLDYEGSPLVRNYPCTLDIPVGTCLMVTGSRLTNGTVLANLNVFEVNGSENSSHSVALRTSQLPLPVYGTISQAVFGKRKEVSRIIVWIEPDKEPTKHLLADLRQKKQEIDKWAGEFIMVFRTGNEMNSFMKKEAPSLPGNISFSEQAEFPLKPSDLPLGKNELRNLPIVVFISMGGVINYQATGYRIGTVGELLTMMK